MRGINKVIIVGACGSDPDSRSFPDGGMVTNISLATSESWKDRQGQQQERTEWHRVVLRDRGNFKLGQIAAQYLKKGSKVYIEGKLQTRSYDKEGQKFYVTEIIAHEMQMVGDKNDATQAATSTSANAAQQTYQPQQRTPSPSLTGPQSYDDFDDDIPF